MAVYNGEKYLREQLDSILAQTDNTWELIAQDDGSKDSSLSILEEYAGKDGRIHVRTNESGNTTCSSIMPVRFPPARFTCLPIRMTGGTKTSLRR